MGRKKNSGICSGVIGQLSIVNYELKNLLIEQSKKVIKEPDFYVGQNGKIISAEYKKWIGKSLRNKLLKKAKNKALANVISQLYRPGSFIGDGGTASVLLFERKTGLHLGKNGGTHEQKAREMISHINNKILKQDLKPSDRKIANKIVRKLGKALVR